MTAIRDLSLRTAYACRGNLGVIYFLTSREAVSTLGALESDAIAPRIMVLPYDEALVQLVLPKATYVFTDFDRLNTHDLIEATRLFRRLKENDREHDRRGNLPAAVSSAEASVAANPTSVETLAHLSRILAKQNRTDDAIAVSERSVALKPWDICERHHLASLLIKVGRLNNARDQLLETLASKQERWKTYLLLNLCLHRARRLFRCSECGQKRI